MLKKIIINVIILFIILFILDLFKIKTFININYIILIITLLLGLFIIINKNIEDISPTTGERIIVIILIIILFSGFFSQLWVAKTRWIGTDEGRLLYDGVLISHGETPFKDFFTRSPFLIYLIAFVQSLYSNPSIMTGRIISLLSNLFTGLLVFLIGKKIYGSKVGLLSSLLVLFSPLIYLQTQIRTEPLQLFLVSLAMYFLYIHFENKKNKFLILYGLFLGLAVLVRANAAVFIITTPILILINYKNLKDSFKKSLYLIIPFLLIIIPPLSYFAWIIKDLVPFLSGASLGLSTIDLNVTLERLKFGLNNIIYLLPFIAIFCIYLIKEKNKKIKQKHVYILFWAISIFLFYFYLTLTRSFWSQYIIELIPPLSLMASYTIVRLYYHLKLNHKKNFLKICIFCIFFISLITSSHLNALQDGVRYEQNRVVEIANYLKDNTPQESNILSGSPIWQYMSNRKVALKLSHPRIEDPEEKKK